MTALTQQWSGTGWIWTTNRWPAQVPANDDGNISGPNAPWRVPLTVARSPDKTASDAAAHAVQSVASEHQHWKSFRPSSDRTSVNESASAIVSPLSWREHKLQGLSHWEYQTLLILQFNCTWYYFRNSYCTGTDPTFAVVNSSVTMLPIKPGNAERKLKNKKQWNYYEKLTPEHPEKNRKHRPIPKVLCLRNRRDEIVCNSNDRGNFSQISCFMVTRDFRLR